MEHDKLAERLNNHARKKLFIRNITLKIVSVIINYVPKFFVNVLNKAGMFQHTREYQKSFHTNMENWGEGLFNLSTPTIMLLLDKSELNSLISSSIFCKGGECILNENISNLAYRIEQELDNKQYFLRLNTRSPKDLMLVHGSLHSIVEGRKDVEKVLFLLMESSRTMQDMIMLFTLEKPAYICFRDVHLIHPHYEFRCFVKGGKLIAATINMQKEAYQKHSYEFLKTEIWNELERFCVEEFWPAYLHKQDIPEIVVDVALFGGDGPNSGPAHRKGKTWLVEINPYGMTDPCFFVSYENIEKMGGLLMEPLDE